MAEEIEVGRRELNKRLTRQRLLDAARALIAERGAFPGAEEVADRAQVSRATYFNYFASKDEVLTALFAGHMEDLGGLLDRLLAEQRSTDESIVTVFEDFVRAQRERPGYHFALVAELGHASGGPDAVAARHDLFHAQLRRLLDAGRARGEVREDFPVDLLAESVAAIYLSVIRSSAGADRADFAQRFLAAGHLAAEMVAAPRRG